MLWVATVILVSVVLSFAAGLGVLLMGIVAMVVYYFELGAWVEPTPDSSRRSDHELE